MSAAHHLPTITESTFAIVSQMLSREGVKNPGAKAVACYIEKLVVQKALAMGGSQLGGNQSSLSFYDGLSEDGLIGKYDDMPTDLSSKQSAVLPTKNLIERFQAFRGTLQDTTIEDIVDDRHRGLE